MKVFNNPHFSKQLTPSHSLANSRTLSFSIIKTPNNQSLIKSYQDLTFHKQEQKENIDSENSGFQEEIIASPSVQGLDGDIFMAKLQRLSEKQKIYIEVENDEEEAQMIQNSTTTSVDLANSQAQFSLVEEMKLLRDQVLKLLREFQTVLGDETLSQQGQRDVKLKIRQDSTTIQEQYAKIINKFNDVIIITELSIERIIPSQQEEEVQNNQYLKEINQLFNLVEEFLEKFNGQKAMMNAYSVLLNDKVEQSGIGCDLITNDEPQRTSLYDFDYFAHDSCTTDTSSDLSKSGKDINLINKQIEQMKQDLQESLKTEILEDSQIIIAETMIYLEDVQFTQDQKLIDHRIQLLESQKNSVQTLLKTSLKRALILCQAKKQSIDFVVNTTIENNKQKAMRRRRFFDIALQIKKQLPNKHKSKKILISELYEDSTQEGVIEQDWSIWIQEQFKFSQIDL